MPATDLSTQTAHYAKGEGWHSLQSCALQSGTIAVEPNNIRFEDTMTGIFLHEADCISRFQWDQRSFQLRDKIGEY